MTVELQKLQDTRTEAQKARNRAILEQIVREDREILDALAKA